MQRLPKQLLCVELTTGDSTYPAPANCRTTVSAVSVTNKSAAARWVTVTLTPSGGTAKHLAYRRVLSIGETAVIYGAVGQTMSEDDVLTATAEAISALDFIASGYETVLSNAV
jgi:hypothetical protein